MGWLRRKRGERGERGEREEGGGEPIPGLALYEYTSCPFCMRVRRFLGDVGLRVESRDVLANREHRAELVEATGRSTVPCLRIEDEAGEVRWMHESADIVAYLRDRHVA